MCFAPKCTSFPSRASVLCFREFCMRHYNTLQRATRFLTTRGEARTPDHSECVSPRGFSQNAVVSAVSGVVLLRTPEIVSLSAMQHHPACVFVSHTSPGTSRDEAEDGDRATQTAHPELLASRGDVATQEACPRPPQRRYIQPRFTRHMATSQPTRIRCILLLDRSAVG